MLPVVRVRLVKLVKLWFFLERVDFVLPSLPLFLAKETFMVENECLLETMSGLISKCTTLKAESFLELCLFEIVSSILGLLVIKESYENLDER